MLFLFSTPVLDMCVRFPLLVFNMYSSVITLLYLLWFLGNAKANMNSPFYYITAQGTELSTDWHLKTKAC